MTEISNDDDLNKIVTNFQTQNLKRELELLDEKLRILDEESQNKINNLTSQLTLEKETEVKLRNQLWTKDKAISELNQIIKEYETELITQKKNLSLKEEKYQEMIVQFNSIKSNFNTITSALNSKEENEKKNELELRKAINDKMKVESKIKELIGLVNEYMKQLDEMNEKYSNLERENNNLKLANSNLIDENKKLFRDNNDYSNELKNIKETIKKCEEMSNTYAEQNKRLTSESENLNKQLIEEKQRIDALLSENNKLNLELNEFKINKSKIENNLAMTIQYQNQFKDKHETDLQNIISFCNDNINKINNWLDNSFIINPNDNQNNMNNNNQILLNSTFTPGLFNMNFDILIKKLINIQNKINNEMMLMHQCLDETNEKYNLFINEKSKYMDILNSIYSKITSEINKKNYFIYDNQINTFNNISNDEFNQLVNSIDAIITQILRYLSSIYDEKNLMSKEIDNCKNTISDFQNINDNLVQENNDYKIKIYNGNNRNNFQDNYNKYEQMNHILEKKIKNYETEIELKQMQINSLEEIVRRRGGNNMNNNTESYDINENYDNNQNLTIKRLEQDREKLIKDNMKLIQYNKKLKEQINNLNQIINSLSWNNSNNQEKSNIEINNNELQ